MSNTYAALLGRVGEFSDSLMADVRDALAALGTGIGIDPDSADGYRRWRTDQKARKSQGIEPNAHHPYLWSEDSVSDEARKRFEAELAERAKAQADKRKVQKALRNSAMATVQRAIAAGKAHPTPGRDLEAFAKSLYVDESTAYFTTGGFISASETAVDGKNAQADTVDIVAAIQRGYLAWRGVPRSGATVFTAPVVISESDSDVELAFD